MVGSEGEDDCEAAVEGTSAKSRRRDEGVDDGEGEDSRAPKSMEIGECVRLFGAGGFGLSSEMRGGVSIATSGCLTLSSFDRRCSSSRRFLSSNRSWALVLGASAGAEAGTVAVAGGVAGAGVGRRSKGSRTGAAAPAAAGDAFARAGKRGLLPGLASCGNKGALPAISLREVPLAERGENLFVCF